MNLANGPLDIDSSNLNYLDVTQYYGWNIKQERAYTDVALEKGKQFLFYARKFRWKSTLIAVSGMFLPHSLRIS